MSDVTRTAKTVTNPMFAEDKSAIYLTVVFNELSAYGALPFRADPKDSTAHGPALYQRAMNGEFGTVAVDDANSPYVAQPKKT